MTVIRREVVIQSAQDLYRFAQDNLKVPTSNRFETPRVKLKRRIFFYIEEHNRNRPNRTITEVKNIRKLRCITAGKEEGILKTRLLSCYCAKCLGGDYQECENTQHVDDWSEVEIEPEVSERCTTPSE